MLNLNSILLFSEHPQELAAFYEKVLDVKPGWSGGDFIGYKVGNSYLTIGPHDQVKGQNQEPERVMLNFETPDVEEEFRRIVDLGAEVVAKPYHPSEDETGTIATLKDPDGNMFQLVSPMEAME